MFIFKKKFIAKKNVLLITCLFLKNAISPRSSLPSKYSINNFPRIEIDSFYFYFSLL